MKAEYTDTGGRKKRYRFRFEPVDAQTPEGALPPEYREVYDWCRPQFGRHGPKARWYLRHYCDRVRFRAPGITIRHYVEVQFDRPQDAFAFRIRWC